MHKFSLFSALILCFGLFSCSQNDQHKKAMEEWTQKNGKVKALSTTAMIGELVKAIGGEHVDTLTLIKGELDPHSYQLVKGDDEKLAAADVIFANGLGLEHGPSLAAYLTQNDKAVKLGNRIMDDNQYMLLYYKGHPDPHIWMDISIWAKAIPHIVNVLSSKDPNHGEEFRLNGEKLNREMLAEHEKVKKIVHEMPPKKRYLVTSHDAFNYFTRAYLAVYGEPQEIWGERFASPEGLSPESQISATDIQLIINHLKKYNIRVIFPESNVSSDSLRKIVQAAKEHGIDVRLADVSLYADAIGEPGSDGDTYLKMIEHDAKVIRDHLDHNGG